MIKRILLGLGILVFVILAALGAGYYLLARVAASLPPLPTPVPPPVATADVPGPTPATTPSPVPSLEPALTPTPTPAPIPAPGASSEPTPTPQKETVKMEFTEEQVNAKLKELMVQYKDKLPLPAENPVIRLHPGKVEAEADIILSGFRLKVWGEGRVEIEQGKPKIVVDTVRAGGKDSPPLPPAFQQLITSRIPSSAILPVDISMEVTSVTILEGKVVIEGIRK